MSDDKPTLQELTANGEVEKANCGTKQAALEAAVGTPEGRLLLHYMDGVDPIATCAMALRLAEIETPDDAMKLEELRETLRGTIDDFAKLFPGGLRQALTLPIVADVVGKRVAAEIAAGKLDPSDAAALEKRRAEIEASVR